MDTEEEFWGIGYTYVFFTFLMLLYFLRTDHYFLIKVYTDQCHTKSFFEHTGT